MPPKLIFLGHFSLYVWKIVIRTKGRTGNMIKEWKRGRSIEKQEKKNQVKK